MVVKFVPVQDFNRLNSATFWKKFGDVLELLLRVFLDKQA